MEENDWAADKRSEGVLKGNQLFPLKKDERTHQEAHKMKWTR